MNNKFYAIDNLFFKGEVKLGRIHEVKKGILYAQCIKHAESFSNSVEGEFIQLTGRIFAFLDPLQGFIIYEVY